MSYPRNNGPFVRVVTSFSYVINESWMFLHANFILFVLLFLHFYSFKDSYALTHTHILKCRSTSTQDPMGNGSAMAYCDFENPIYQADDESEEDCEVPGELARLL